ncbi:M48 family metallopeptidase [Alcanivorax sp. DP30]|uniref:M48 family metallopeptidase n=1 Tax=Alcanivorax sp. DP30 TaxID=2606217 RepID=UPI0013694007|nr:M48 family metallopeptidase [Alcanivorax sp. DP30]MZR63735.1 M48 family metalloprotease [Alcanivorax sp. DP30]
MDFFQQQQKAKQRTGLLVLYFCLAVIAVVVCVTTAVVLLLGMANIQLYPQNGTLLFNPVIYWTALGTFAVIVGGCLLKTWQLRKGGSALAEMLGGRLINASTTDQAERQLLNVVEEMSIASGIAVPQVYVMDQENTINAFAAGFRPSEAVIAVTRGSLDRFSRDELQAVIGHEFSHILNSDIRINLRMVAVLAGILAVGKIGEILLRSGSRSRRAYSSRSKNNGLPALGLALVVIGYVGLFFGRLIKAAISRQRELLADASAVQFTRNPAGLAGALIHIRNDGGSHLASSHAEDMSHMCFAPSIPMKLKQWLATHPSLDERLAALGPEWVARARARARQQDSSSPASASSVAPPEGAAGFAAGRGNNSASAAPSQQVGTVQQGDMAYAQQLLSALPGSIRSQAHTPEGARQVLFALVLAGSRADSTMLLARCKLADSQAFQSLTRAVRELGPETRLPLIDMALPSLKSQPRDSRRKLLADLERLCNADQHFSLFEWTLLALARQQLDDNAGRNRHTRFHRLGAVAQELQQLFSVLVWAGGASEAQAEALFRQHAGSLLPAARSLLPLSHCSSAKLFSAVDRLADLSPLLKGPIIDCAVDLAMADGTLKTAERELLRALSSLLECPLPPLFDRR